MYGQSMSLISHGLCTHPLYARSAHVYLQTSYISNSNMLTYPQSQQAYGHGDGQGAHALSEEGKRHGLQMEQYNRQASEFIFRENNAPGRVAPDTIDLHGQFVEEAADILEQRITAARQRREKHLHVIVGKGTPSPGHIQKIKPKVEDICRREGLNFHTEPNEGRIYVDLTGAPVDMGAVHGWQGYQQNAQDGYAGGTGPGGPGGYSQPTQFYPEQYQNGQQTAGMGYDRPPKHHQQHGGQGQGQNDEVEKLARKFLPRILRYLQRLLCN